MTIVCILYRCVSIPSRHVRRANFRWRHFSFKSVVWVNSSKIWQVSVICMSLCVHACACSFPTFSIGLWKKITTGWVVSSKPQWKHVIMFTPKWCCHHVIRPTLCHQRLPLMPKWTALNQVMVGSDPQAEFPSLRKRVSYFVSLLQAGLGGGGWCLVSRDPWRTWEYERIPADRPTLPALHHPSGHSGPPRRGHRKWVCPNLQDQIQPGREPLDFLAQPSRKAGVYQKVLPLPSHPHQIHYNLNKPYHSHMWIQLVIQATHLHWSEMECCYCGQSGVSWC